MSSAVFMYCGDINVAADSVLMAPALATTMSGEQLQAKLLMLHVNLGGQAPELRSAIRHVG